MLENIRAPWRVALVAACLCVGAGNIFAQQPAATQQTVRFTVVSVDGDTVVVKGANGTAKEYTASPDQRFTVDGKQVGVRELKPGMTGTAVITTTTKVIPVHVTEVKNGEVLQSAGNTILVRTQNGIKMFSEKEVRDRQVKIVRDGKPVELSGLRVGDHLTATIVTTGTPQVLTERQVQATLSTPPPPAAAPPVAAAPARTTAPAGTSRAATPAPAPAASDPAAPSVPRTLPKTASERPVMLQRAFILLAIAGSLTMIRRRLS